MFFNFVLWTLALIPLVATARRDLYWTDPFFFLAFIFFLTSCLGGVVFWIAPQSLQPLLVFVPISDIWTITEVILSFSLVWFIVLIINNSPDAPKSAAKKPRHRRTLVISEEHTIAARNGTSPRGFPWNRPEMGKTVSLRTLAIRQRALKVGYFFLVLGVFAWLGLFRSFDGYLDRLLRISIRVLAPGEGRYVSLLARGLLWRPPSYSLLGP